MPADKAGEVRKQLTGDFLKGIKGDSATEAALAAVELAIADTRPDVVRFLEGVVRALQPQPEYVETLALRRMASLDLPPLLIQQVLSAVRAGPGRRASRERSPGRRRG